MSSHLIHKIADWHTDPSKDDIPLQLRSFLKQVVEPLDLIITTKPYRDEESAEYGATILSIEDKSILFRVAKTTPTKIGQFVTVWKRSPISGKIIPIDFNDGFDFVFVASFDENNRGVFILNKEILLKKKIYSKDGKKGKLAFRVYAPWVDTIVPQAKSTQKWMCKYFLSLNDNFPRKNESQLSFERELNVHSPLETFKYLFNK